MDRTPWVAAYWSHQQPAAGADAALTHFSQRKLGNAAWLNGCWEASIFSKDTQAGRQTQTHSSSSTSSGCDTTGSTVYSVPTGVCRGSNNGACRLLCQLLKYTEGNYAATCRRLSTPSCSITASCAGVLNIWLSTVNLGNSPNCFSSLSNPCDSSFLLLWGHFFHHVLILFLIDFLPSAIEIRRSSDPVWTEESWWTLAQYTASAADILTSLQM